MHNVRFEGPYIHPYVRSAGPYDIDVDNEIDADIAEIDVDNVFDVEISEIEFFY